MTEEPSTDCAVLSARSKHRWLVAAHMSYIMQDEVFLSATLFVTVAYYHKSKQLLNTKHEYS